MPERTPGDYYADKRKEAKALMIELDLHKQECHPESWALKLLLLNCKTCEQLEKRLELARYTGD